jgi:hypothetical protein
VPNYFLGEKKNNVSINLQEITQNPFCQNWLERAWANATNALVQHSSEKNMFSDD